MQSEDIDFHMNDVAYLIIRSGNETENAVSVGGQPNTSADLLFVDAVNDFQHIFEEV